ncbi:MAG: hypothetical protein HKN78_02175 [Sphingomonadaceae bacterium]|nr:hypothetical protein [Sphingomonadaceae bacterium]
MVLPAPIVARATIDRVRRVDEERAIGLAPGHVRFYIEADLVSLIRSSQSVPGRVRYLVDVPLTADGRRPRLDDREVLLMAAPVAGRAGEIQLTSPDAQIDWTETYEATIRQMLTEANSPDAPGVVTGIGSAFNVAGSLPGESETQIFLATSEGRPVSLSILRRFNQRPRWNVALGEIVDRATPPPERDTLLWYRLACFLPDRLPASSLQATAGGEADTAREDYRLVISDLGQCQRNRS